MMLYLNDCFMLFFFVNWLVEKIYINNNIIFLCFFKFLFILMKVYKIRFKDNGMVLYF